MYTCFQYIHKYTYEYVIDLFMNFDIITIRRYIHKKLIELLYISIFKFYLFPQKPSFYSMKNYNYNSIPLLLIKLAVF